MSYSVAGSPPSRLYERMGNRDGVSRSITMSRSGGRSARASFTRSWTSCSAYRMSVPDVNVMFISDAPRMDRDVTLMTPGTMLMASSMGRVMLNTTWRAHSEDPWATMVTRGNVNSG